MPGSRTIGHERSISIIRHPSATADRGIPVTVVGVTLRGWSRPSPDADGLRAHHAGIPATRARPCGLRPGERMPHRPIGIPRRDPIGRRLAADITTPFATEGTDPSVRSQGEIRGRHGDAMRVPRRKSVRGGSDASRTGRDPRSDAVALTMDLFVVQVLTKQIIQYRCFRLQHF